MQFRRTDATIERPHPAPWPPTYTVPANVHEALRRIERLDQDIAAGLDPETARKVLRQALTRNAHGTASIEGNPLTLTDVQSLLARGPTPDALDVPDEREIINWTAWMEQLGGEPFPRNAEDICRLHATLFDGVLHDAGELKQTDNFVGRTDGTVVYVPTTPEHTPAEMEASLAWLHDATDHPIVKGMVWFHEFQAIHPFRDGNGRIGRALLTWWLHEQGLVGIRYAHVDATFNADRPPYYAALAAAEHDWDRTPWITYLSDILVHTFEDAADRLHFLSGLPLELNDRQRDLARWWRRMDRARPGRRLKVADIHAAHPIIPRRTLQADLRRLVDVEVLDRDGVGKGTTYALATS